MRRSGGADPTNRGDLDDLRARLSVVEEFLRWRELMLRCSVDRAIDGANGEPTALPLPAADTTAADETAPAPPGERKAAPTAGEPLPPEVVGALRGAQKALLRHPVATQAAFRALAAEGRRFATTPEGEEWRRRLEGSRSLERVRLLWEALSLTLVDAEADTMLPASFLELFVRLAGDRGPDPSELEDLASELGLPFLSVGREEPARASRNGSGGDD